MAMKIKSGKSFNDKRTETRTSAYAIVSRINHCPSYKFIHIDIDVFPTEEIRNNQNPNDRIDTISGEFKGDEYDQYFGDDVLKADGVSLLSQCYKAMNEKENHNKDLIVDSELWEPDE